MQQDVVWVFYVLVKAWLALAAVSAAVFMVWLGVRRNVKKQAQMAKAENEKA